MSDTVKLSSALPKDDELNGLDDTAEELIADRRTIRAGFVLYDTAKVVEKTDDDTTVPYIRFRKFVPLGKASEVPASLQKLILKADQDRTGREPLPFDAVDAHEVEAE